MSKEARLSPPYPKFGPRHLGAFAHEVHETLKNFERDEKLVFDLSRVEWIAHEELVYLSALFHQLYSQGIAFTVQMRRERERPNERQALQILNLWEKWKIQSFVEPDEQGFYPYERYFDIDEPYIRFLRTDILKQSPQAENTLYNWYRVTPFTTFRLEQSLDLDEYIAANINNAYQLDQVTTQLLKKYHSQTPFLNRSLSFIITKELYENSMEHAYMQDSLKGKKCFFGLSLRSKIEKNLGHVQQIIRKNMEEEEIPESKSFFLDANGTSYLNRSFLQFTFLDFGAGIPATLSRAYRKFYSEKKLVLNQYFSRDHDQQEEDSRILEYALDFSSSRLPISEKFMNRESVPRGLFDVLEIVRRYKGMIVVRSNWGKILFDLSKDEQATKDHVHFFGDRKSTRLNSSH